MTETDIFLLAFSVKVTELTFRHVTYITLQLQQSLRRFLDLLMLLIPLVWKDKFSCLNSPKKTEKKNGRSITETWIVRAHFIRETLHNVSISRSNKCIR